MANQLFCRLLDQDPAVPMNTLRKNSKCRKVRCNSKRRKVRWDSRRRKRRKVRCNTLGVNKPAITVKWQLLWCGGHYLKPLHYKEQTLINPTATRKKLKHDAISTLKREEEENVVVGVPLVNSEDSTCQQKKSVELPRVSASEQYEYMSSMVNKEEVDGLIGCSFSYPPAESFHSYAKPSETRIDEKSESPSNCETNKTLSGSQKNLASGTTADSCSTVVMDETVEDSCCGDNCQNEDKFIVFVGQLQELF